jgi:hypothetical protein
MYGVVRVMANLDNMILIASVRDALYDFGGMGV